MSLQTKSAQLPATKGDGIRICIMRRPDEKVEWDIWMPHLAPSHELLTEYHKNEINWENFCLRFQDEVIKKERKYVEILITLAQAQTVTILCWEIDPQFCHRRLLAEECQKKEKKLHVIIR